MCVHVLWKTNHVQGKHAWLLLLLCDSNNKYHDFPPPHTHTHMRAHTRLAVRVDVDDHAVLAQLLLDQNDLLRALCIQAPRVPWLVGCV